MKNERDNVTPLFINGEFNDRAKKKRPSSNNSGNEKLPTKRYGFSDFLLTLIGIALVGYGIYMYTNKEETKKEDNSNVVEKKSNKTSNKKKEEKEIDYDALVSLSEIGEKRVFSEQDLSLLSTGLETSSMSNNLKLVLAARITDKKSFDNNTNTYILEENLDNSIKKLFGNITYDKAVFTYGNNTFTYNQETKRYYLFENSVKYALSYKRYNYVTKEKVEDKLIVKNFVAYTTNDNTRSTTIGNKVLQKVITESNLKEEYMHLRYFEYEFVLEDGNYHLKKITLK